jgi:hypothetical protein
MMKRVRRQRFSLNAYVLRRYRRLVVEHSWRGGLLVPLSYDTYRTRCSGAL